MPLRDSVVPQQDRRPGLAAPRTTAQIRGLFLHLSAAPHQTGRRSPLKPAPDTLTPLPVHWAASEQPVRVTRIKVARPGIRLVFEDAVRDSSRCEADDEHAPAGNIHPSGMSLGLDASGVAPTRLGTTPETPGTSPSAEAKLLGTGSQPRCLRRDQAGRIN